MLLTDYEDKHLRHYVSLSFGKDSLAMFFMLLEKGIRIDEVMFYNTGMEFKALYKVRDKMLTFFAREGIVYTELYPKEDFLYKMLDKLVHGRDGSIRYGYSWCGGVCRWATSDKIAALRKHTKDGIDFVGIAYDEPKRIEKEKRKNKRFPLYEWGITERMALDYCYSKHIYWEENGIRLYEILKRVSCYCCRFKNLAELKNIYIYLPEYWQLLKELQIRNRLPFRKNGETIFDLEDRFRKETEDGFMGNRLRNIA